MKKSSKNDYVLNQVKTPIDENIQLQQIAESANITKKALMENIISSYLHEEKVSELLPNMIDQNRRLSEFLKKFVQKLKKARRHHARFVAEVWCLLADYKMVA